MSANTPHDDIMDALEVAIAILTLIQVEALRIAGDNLAALIFCCLSVAYVLSLHIKRRLDRKIRLGNGAWPD